MRASLDQVILVQENDFSLGGLTVSPSKRLVMTAEGRELLQPRIMQVLVALARRRGEVVSRDALMASCWGGFAVSDDAIHRCIARIRRLGESLGGFNLETIPRVGYQLNELAAETPAAEADPSAPRASAAINGVAESEGAESGRRSWFESRTAMAMAGFVAGVLVTTAGFVGAHLL